MAANVPDPVAPSASIPKRGRVRRVFNVLAWALLGVLLLLISIWAAAALYIDVAIHWLRIPFAVLYLIALTLIWIFSKRRIFAVLSTVIAFSLVLSWWLLIPPSNERDWQPDVAVLPYSTTDGSQLTIHNIRNCDYRTETDYDAIHYDK